jgi:RNA polymerase sigma-70 factor (ECF subfamily)
MTRRTVLRLVAPESAPPPAPASDPGSSTPVAVSSSRGGHRALASLDDEALVALASRSDLRAAEVLYRRHVPFALNLAARVAGTTVDVEDIVHDAFLRALQQLERLRNPAAFRMWLGSIVVHGVRSKLRRDKLRRMLGLSESRGAQPVELDRIASPSASPAVRAELAQLYALLGTLAADDRIAWTLRFIEGHELEEAATLAGCSLATVKRRIARAQRYIDDHYVDMSAKAPRDEETPS